MRCLRCHTKSVGLFDFPALFPSRQWWGSVRSCRETWLRLLCYGFSPVAFDKPWQCSPPHSPAPNQLRLTQGTSPSCPCREITAEPLADPPTVFGDNVELHRMQSPCLREFTLQTGQEKWWNWTNSVSEGWGNSRARRTWQEIYALARQHRTQIRLRNGNALLRAGFLWTWSSFRNHLASPPVLTSASPWRPLGLIFRQRD